MNDFNGSWLTLRVSTKTFNGYYLENANGTFEVPVKASEFETQPKIDDEVRVFAYVNAEGETLVKLNYDGPAVGQVGIFRVDSVKDFGAFLTWLEDCDLLLPNKDITGKVSAKDNVVAGLYIDKKGKVVASMMLSKFLASDSEYDKGDMVKGIVYRKDPRFGAFVAVEGKYDALIGNSEMLSELELATEYEFRVINKNQAGKLNLSLRESAHKQMDKDVEFILGLLEEAEGFLPFNDKSDPDLIRDKLKMTKRGFKRAVGRMLKEGMIAFENEGIRKK